MRGNLAEGTEVTATRLQCLSDRSVLGSSCCGCLYGVQVSFPPHAVGLEGEIGWRQGGGDGVDALRRL